MMTVPETRAKHAIESGVSSLHAAAEDIAAAQKQGATQRQIAEALGKSAEWVNRLLKWRESGFQDVTAFGPQAKSSRQRRVQAPEQKRQKPATTSEQAQAAAARARAETAKAEAAQAKADAQKAKAEAAKARTEARTARAKEKANSYSFFQAAFNGTSNKKIPNGARERLVKALGMLGSDHGGERANAARVVEKQRAQLGMTWDDLIVPADDARARAA
jgi:hypothetical protein